MFSSGKIQKPTLAYNCHLHANVFPYSNTYLIPYIVALLKPCDFVLKPFSNQNNNQMDRPHISH